MWKGGAGLGGPSRFGFARSGDGARVTCLVLEVLVAATAGARGRVIVVVAGGGADNLGKAGCKGGESGLPIGGASVEGETGAVWTFGAFGGGTFAGGRAFSFGLDVAVVVVVVVWVAVGSTGCVAEAAAAVTPASGAARFRELPPWPSLPDAAGSDGTSAAVPGRPSDFGVMRRPVGTGSIASLVASRTCDIVMAREAGLALCWK